MRINRDVVFAYFIGLLVIYVGVWHTIYGDNDVEMLLAVAGWYFFNEQISVSKEIAKYIVNLSNIFMLLFGVSLIVYYSLYGPDGIIPRGFLLVLCISVIAGTMPKRIKENI